MMLRINLLPWRVIKYERAKKQHLFVLIGVIAAALLIIIAWRSHLNTYVSAGGQQIDTLTKKLKLAVIQVRKDKIYEQQYNEMLHSIKIVKQLQANQYKVAYFFNHFPALVPDGVRLRSLRYRDDAIELIGDAQSNEFIVALIDAIKKTNWLVDPGLEILSHQQGKVVAFQIKAKLNINEIIT